MSTKGGREDGGTLGTGLGPWKPGLRIRIRIILEARYLSGSVRVKSWIRIRIKVKIRIHRVKSWIRIHIIIKIENSEALETKNKALGSDNEGLEGGGIKLRHGSLKRSPGRSTDQ
jgi:hypothetical protein